MPETSGPEMIPLAIIGMGCRLPGADDLESYWRLIIEGRSAVREMPADRMDQSLYYDPEVGVRGKSYSRLAATLSSRAFDRQACPIPEELVRGVDNAHLLMCGVAAEALRHAGLDPFQLPSSLRRCGVYIGHAQGSELGCDYTYATCVGEAAEFLREVPDLRNMPAEEQDELIRTLVADVRRRLPQRAPDAPDVSACMVAGTISKAFGLDGPFVAINSACASSLQAMLLGARALQLGHVEMAIVGGASDCKGDTLVLFSQAQAMSSTGSRPFDAEADGLIVGEGYAAVVMKRLDRALADGDRVLAVVRGLGVSSDGKGKSLWAPRKEGQMKAMERAYRCGVEMSRLQYLEAHSTATQLGDATELNTLAEVLAPHIPPGHKIPVTSVKANIGHTLETAGLAGVIKTVLCMQHGMIPPAINITRLNPNINWDRAPVFVPAQAAPWPAPADGHPRRAGVNAFGIGGLNMHVVLDEFTDAARSLISSSAPSSGTARTGAHADAVAVIGRGCIFPGAANLNEFWRLLHSGADPRQPVPADRWRADLAFQPHSREPFKTPCTLGGFITGYEHDWRRHKIPPKQIQQADPLQFMLLDAMDEAFAEAGYDRREFDRSRAGVIVGTEFGGDFAFQLQLGLRIPELKRHIERLLMARGWDNRRARSAAEHYADVLLAHWPALIDETGSFSTSTLASRLGKTWNLMGGAAAVDAGDASSLAALAIAVDMLLAGDCDLMVCAGAQRRMALPEYETLAIKGILPSGESRSPLDAAANGYVPGEGVGVVILKRLADARRDGDRILSIIRGVAAAHTPEPAQALHRAMQRSFSQSGRQPSEISIVELDAAGSQAVTRQQLSALAELQDAVARTRPLLVGCVAGQIGHTQGAAGMASLLKASLEVTHGVAPAACGITQPCPALTDHADRLRVNTDAVSLVDDSSAGPPVAAVVSFSRGMAFHTIVEPDSAVARPEAARRETQPARAPQTENVMSRGPEMRSLTEMANLEAFLINFVVEQTGYPPEVVELDADLEADLGIDSIKKAQLFGELQEYFDITPTGDVTLDDFPTLRHVLNFLTDHSAPVLMDESGSSTAATSSQRRRDSHPAELNEPSVAGVAHAELHALPELRPVAATSGRVEAGAHSPVNVGPWRIFRCAGPDWHEVERRIIDAAANADAAFVASAAGQRFSANDRCRAAVVADSPAALARKLEHARPLLAQPAARRPLEHQGVFLREVCGVRPRIAFVFPGQGSQYHGMFRELVEQCPEAQAAVQEVDRVLAELGEGTFAEIAWDSASPLGTDVSTTQLAILLADYVMLCVLRERGIHPDVVLGHSYGEFAALIAAGCWDLSEAIRTTRARCDAIESSLTTQGGMLATSAPVEELLELVRPFDDLHIANRNAPDQTVVGGRKPALRELERLLKARGHHTRLLPVPCAFHTPLMHSAVEPFERTLCEARIESPRVTLHSVADNQPVTTANDVRRNLAAHLTQPVRYMDLIRQVAEAPTVFVEAGPQQALTRLNARILGEATADLIACDQPKRPGSEQLLHVQALLEVCGTFDQTRSADLAPLRMSEIVHFDATARRRARMREAASRDPRAPEPADGPKHRAVPSVDRTSAAPASAIRTVTAQPSSPVQSPQRITMPPAPAPSRAAAVAEPAAAGAGPALPGKMPRNGTHQPPRMKPDGPSGPSSAELEAFLINFVVEQTGYPAEVVELDADLEADLGIDSIKKAQLFGELQEYFDITPTEGLTLDDFPTLRHVVRFLATAACPADAKSNDFVDHPSAPAAQAEEPADVREASAPFFRDLSHAASDVPLIQLRGTAYEIGRQHGSEFREPIRRALRRLADLSDGRWNELPVSPEMIAAPEECFDSQELDELRGIAEGAGVSLGSLLAWNLTLLGELGTAAAHGIAGGSGESVPPLHGVRDDLCLTGSLSECLSPIVQIREQAGEIPLASVTFAGFIGSLAGLNAQGLTVSGLVPRSAPRGERRPPGEHLLFVRRALATASSVKEVERLFRDGTGGQWQCGASELNGHTIRITRGADGVHLAHGTGVISTEPVGIDRLPEVSTISGMKAALTSTGRIGGLCCLVIFDARRGELHVGAGSFDAPPPLKPIPVAGLLGGPLLAPEADSPISAGSPSDVKDAPLDDRPHEDTRTQRFVMTVVPAPLPPHGERAWQPAGPVVIVGRNAVADALQTRLEAAGTTVHTIATGPTVDAVPKLEELWSREPIYHLFLTTARDETHRDPGDTADWVRIVEEEVRMPYFVCQRWLQLAHDAGCINRCSVVAVTNLGGDFGFRSDVHAPQSGALTGLMKALCLEYFVLREHKGFLAKAIDAPPGEDPAKLAACICAELESGAIDYEVAYSSGRRFLQLAVHRDAPVRPHADIRPGGIWIVTGGARGITAESALELGRRFGLRLHLIGSSAAPEIPPERRDLDDAGMDLWRSEVMIAAREQGVRPNDAWELIRKSLEIDRTLRRFESAGVQATYHTCDVADRDALAAVLETIRRTDGPIEGILHGAGIERPCRFEKKSVENVRATFDAKVAGACHLMQLTRQDPIRHFIAYGSISGRLGSNGQTDYCAASDMLCKLVSWYRAQRPHCRAIAFHWHPWDEVGMAARPETRASLERTNGPALMPKAEGLRHLVRELHSPHEDCEVLITDREFHHRYYPEPGADMQTQEEKPANTDDLPPSTSTDHDPDDVPRIASRHVLRMIDAPLSQTGAAGLPEAAAILGDHQPAAALRDRLAAEGVQVELIPADDVDAALSRLEEISSRAVCRGLFLMTGRETEAFSLTDRHAAESRNARLVLLPYRVAQRWVQLLPKEPWNEPAIIVAATSLGGEFGLEGPVPCPESGALCGLLKSIHVEHARTEEKRFQVKVVDAPADEPVDRLADAICREIASGLPEIEVSWTNGRRRVLRCQREPLSEARSVVPRQRGVWVVTGGARGITAAAALDLGRRYGLKLHLIGKSPAPRPDAPWGEASPAELAVIKRRIVLQAVAEGRSPEEDWDRVRKDREIHQSLRSFAEAGVEATYHCCDVADWDALAATLERIRNMDGPIEGIIHGAGYAKSSRFESQSIDRVRRTLAPKLDGTLALMALTQRDPLKYFVAFGSLSGRCGGNGLADYAAANDLLAKLCDWFRQARPECRTGCIHWQTWDRIGMAMIADGVEITRNAFPMQFLAPEEGIAHLRDELCAGMPEREVLITDGYFQRIFYPRECMNATAGGHTAAANQETEHAEAPPLPLMDRLARSDDGGSLKAFVSFDPAGDPFLAQHRLRDKPFLPGVVGMEALIEAVVSAFPMQNISTLCDVEIANGLAFHSDEPITATVHVAPDGDRFAVRLTTELRDRQGRIVDPQRVHVRGAVDLTNESRATSAEGPGRPPLGWFRHRYAENSLLTHGPAFRCLTDIAYQYDGGWGRIIAPDPRELLGPNRTHETILPLAVLDACLVACGSFLFLQFGGQIEVPYGIERLHWLRQPRPGETCIVRTFFRGREERHSRFDFALYSEQDEPLLAAVGYRTIRLGGQPS